MCNELLETRAKPRSPVTLTARHALRWCEVPVLKPPLGRWLAKGAMTGGRYFCWNGQDYSLRPASNLNLGGGRDPHDAPKITTKKGTRVYIIIYIYI